MRAGQGGSAQGVSSAPGHRAGHVKSQMTYPLGLALEAHARPGMHVWGTWVTGKRGGAQSVQEVSSASAEPRQFLFSPDASW